MQTNKNMVAIFWSKIDNIKTISKTTVIKQSD